MQDGGKKLPAWLSKLMQVRGVEWIIFVIVLGVMLIMAGDTLFRAFSPGGSQPLTGGDVVPVTAQHSGAAADSSLEGRLGRVLSNVSGAGAVEVFIAYESRAEPSSQQDALPSGAVVVAEGADSISVRITLQQAVQTALGLPASRVEVLPMEARDPPGGEPAQDAAAPEEHGGK